jgi:hypothetical protein
MQNSNDRLAWKRIRNILSKGILNAELLEAEAQVMGNFGQSPGTTAPERGNHVAHQAAHVLIPGHPARHFRETEIEKDQRLSHGAIRFLSALQLPPSVRNGPLRTDEQCIRLFQFGA